MTRDEMRLNLVRWGSSIDTISKLEADLRSYRQWADDARNTLKAASLTGMPGGGVRKDMTDIVIEVMRRADMYDEEIKRIGERIGQAVEHKRKIDALIERLNEQERMIVHMRYADKLGWKDISEKIGYSEDRARHIDIGIMNKMIGWYDG